MGGKIPWLVSLIDSLATAELPFYQRPASHGAWCENISVLNLTTKKTQILQQKIQILQQKTTNQYKQLPLLPLNDQKSLSTNQYCPTLAQLGLGDFHIS